jgi:hypothetical protein
MKLFRNFRKYPKFRWKILGYSLIYGHFELSDSGIDYADPHMYQDKYVFFERLEHKENQGKIYVRDLSTGKDHLYFENDLHCSYPYIFNHQGVEYICFEQHVTKKTEIYTFNQNAISKENLSATIFNGRAVVDVTFFTFQNRLHAIYNEDTGNIGDHGGILKLSRFSDFSFIEEYTKIIASDVRNSRCAGTVKVIGDKLYFTTQKKISGSYGDGIFINSLSLTDIELKRQMVSELKYMKNCHHVDWRQNSRGYVFDQKIVN